MIKRGTKRGPTEIDPTDADRESDRKKAETALVWLCPILKMPTPKETDFGDVEEDKAKFDNFVLVKAMLRALYDFDPAKNTMMKLPFNAEQWRKRMSRLRLGLLRGTKLYGTTSVSQGATKAAFDLLLPGQTLPRFWVWLNGGTGGLKAQVYGRTSKEIGGVYCIFELKKCEVNPNPNAVKLGPYTPEKLASGTSQDEQVRLEQFMAQLDKELVAHTKFHLKDRQVKVCAFMTGLARAYYEKANTAVRSAMNTSLSEYYKKHSYVQPYEHLNYFISQDLEGKLEQLGVQSMYDNLAKDGLVPKINVVQSLGRGLGSTQAGPFKSTGMAADDILTQLDRELHTTDLAQKFYTEWGVTNGVICLKSLFGMYIEDHPKLIAHLMKVSKAWLTIPVKAIIFGDADHNPEAIVAKQTTTAKTVAIEETKSNNHTEEEEEEDDEEEGDTSETEEEEEEDAKEARRVIDQQQKTTTTADTVVTLHQVQEAKTDNCSIFDQKLLTGVAPCDKFVKRFGCPYATLWHQLRAVQYTVQYIASEEPGSADARVWVSGAVQHCEDIHAGLLRCAMIPLATTNAHSSTDAQKKC